MLQASGGMPAVLFRPLSNLGPSFTTQGRNQHKNIRPQRRQTRELSGESFRWHAFDGFCLVCIEERHQTPQIQVRLVLSSSCVTLWTQESIEAT